ncbi:MAG: hypothetical protein KKF89_01825 [Nanoarchaeota archaeon]|nr:hypothetical protein [Nanoarchaeota archaeon]MBU1854436.1 hypothetical protein [Nanoarchaeota archaeon]
MSAIKTFEEYAEEGIVRKISPDKQRAANLKQESERKYKSLLEMIQKMGVTNENANDYVEYCYNIIMFLIRAKMFEKGYNSSGQGAHEAEVSYTKKLGFTEPETQFLNQLRYFRNGILYYGKSFDKEYAEKVINYLEKIEKKIKIKTKK